MKYAVISDIHGNIEALDAVIKYLDEEHIDKLLCLGDTVGYGASPNECVEKIKSYSFRTILGNHDLVAIGVESGENFTNQARDAIMWTKNILRDDLRNYLSSLNIKETLDNNIIIVHGSPVDKDEYLIYNYQIKSCYSFIEKNMPLVKICFFGHTHYQAIWKKENNNIFTPSINEKTISINPDNIYLINPGSVGQSRGQGPLACFIIYDSEKQILSLKRINYDYKKAAAKIIEAGLPPFLAERLELGI